MDKNIRVVCATAEETRLVGQSLGRILKPHDLVEIRGDVGAGKTTLVQGITSGLECEQDASSPTFCVSQIYSGRLDLIHYDLYRLEDAGLVLHEISESINEPNTAVVIEWGDIATAVLPRNRYKITIAPDKNEARKININVPKTPR